MTVALVPTGMKHGVSTTPCGVVRSPARAAPSRASTVNAKPSAIIAAGVAAPSGVALSPGVRCAVEAHSASIASPKL